MARTRLPSPIACPPPGPRVGRGGAGPWFGRPRRQPTPARRQQKTGGGGWATGVGDGRGGGWDGGAMRPFVSRPLNGGGATSWACPRRRAACLRNLSCPKPPPSAPAPCSAAQLRPHLPAAAATYPLRPRALLPGLRTLGGKGGDAPHFRCRPPLSPHPHLPAADVGAGRCARGGGTPHALPRPGRCAPLALLSGRELRRGHHLTGLARAACLRFLTNIFQGRLLLWWGAQRLGAGGGELAGWRRHSRQCAAPPR